MGLQKHASLLQRVAIATLSAGLFACGIVQVVSTARWRHAMLASSTQTQGQDDPMRTNEAVSEMLAVSEFVAVFTLGCCLMLLWHLLSWVAFTAHVATTPLLGTLCLQVISIFFYVSIRSEYSLPNSALPSGVRGDITREVEIVGPAAAVALVLCFLLVIALHVLVSFSEHGRAIGQPHGHHHQHDDRGTTAIAPGASSSAAAHPAEHRHKRERAVAVLVAAIALAVVVIRGGVAASLMDAYVTRLEALRVANTTDVTAAMAGSRAVSQPGPHGNRYAYDFAFRLVIITGVSAGAAVAHLAHAGLFWNAISHMVTLGISGVSLSFDLWALGVAGTYASRGGDVVAVPDAPWSASLAPAPAQDKRLTALVALCAIQVSVQLMQLVSQLALSTSVRAVSNDGHATHADKVAGKGHSAKRASCFRAMAMGLVFVLFVCTFSLYLARGALTLRTLALDFDIEHLRSQNLVVREKIVRNAATPMLIRVSAVELGAGIGLSVYALAHLFMWTRITAFALSFYMLVASGLSLISFGFAAKHLALENKNASTSFAANGKWDSVARMTIVQPWLSIGLALVVITFRIGLMPVSKSGRRIEKFDVYDSSSSYSYSYSSYATDATASSGTAASASSDVTADSGAASDIGITATSDSGVTATADSGAASDSEVTATSDFGVTATADSGAASDSGVTATADSGAASDSEVTATADSGAASDSDVTATSDSGVTATSDSGVTATGGSGIGSDFGVTIDPGAGTSAVFDS